MRYLSTILLITVVSAVPISAQTWIDFNQPIEWTGTLRSSAVYWSEACPATVIFQTFRREGDSLTLIAEQGPFDTVEGTNQIFFSPPLQVRQGDFPALTRTGNCGSPERRHFGFPIDGFLFFDEDFRGGVVADGRLFRSALSLEILPGTKTEFITRIIPVVASAPGAYGSHFRTALELHNPYPRPLKGRFVFHAAGRPGTIRDPALSFALGPNATVSYPDIVAAVGGSGLGSIDIVTELGQYKSASAGPDDGKPQYTPTPFPLDLAPAATVRVFDDSRETASAGFTARAVDATVYPIARHAEILHPSAIGSLVVPDDLQRFRLNVGVRTLFSGATLSIIVRDSSGNAKRQVTREYLPTWFEQVDVITFTGGPVEPNDSISVRVLFGSAIVYGSRVDNASNDASFELIHAEWFSPISQ